MYELQLYTTKQMNIKVVMLKKINQAWNNILYRSTWKTQKKKRKEARTSHKSANQDFLHFIFF